MLSEMTHRFDASTAVRFLTYVCGFHFNDYRRRHSFGHSLTRSLLSGPAAGSLQKSRTSREPTILMCVGVDVYASVVDEERVESGSVFA